MFLDLTPGFPPHRILAATKTFCEAVLDSPLDVTRIWEPRTGEMNADLNQRRACQIFAAPVIFAYKLDVYRWQGDGLPSAH